MRTTRHPSPLPPDPAMVTAGSPLPPSARAGTAGSPLPPDPLVVMAREAEPAPGCVPRGINR